MDPQRLWESGWPGATRKDAEAQAPELVQGLGPCLLAEFPRTFIAGAGQPWATAVLLQLSVVKKQISQTFSSHHRLVLLYNAMKWVPKKWNVKTNTELKPQGRIDEGATASSHHSELPPQKTTVKLRGLRWNGSSFWCGECGRRRGGRSQAKWVLSFCSFCPCGRCSWVFTVLLCHGGHMTISNYQNPPNHT